MQAAHLQPEICTRTLHTPLWTILQLVLHVIRTSRLITFNKKVRTTW